MKTRILDDVANHLQTYISDIPYESCLQLKAMQYISQNLNRYSNKEIRYAIQYIFQKSKGA